MTLDREIFEIENDCPGTRLCENATLVLSQNGQEHSPGHPMAGALSPQTKNRVGNLWKVPADGSAPKQITGFTPELIFAIALSKDGRLAISRGDRASDLVLMKRQ
jgi:hypothetical protein